VLNNAKIWRLEGSKMDKNILRNSSWLWFGQLGVKAISFGYTLFIIRYLSVSDFGFYVTATAYFSLLSSISENKR
jgi:O-antigen/teichoic acid export membrane protein